MYARDQKELTLDQYFQSHIYEIAEVLLSVIGDIYKQSKT